MRFTLSPICMAGGRGERLNKGCKRWKLGNDIKSN
jgi:hypothetical protein